jgi:hypothetical protein
MAGNKREQRRSFTAARIRFSSSAVKTGLGAWGGVYMPVFPIALPISLLFFQYRLAGRVPGQRLGGGERPRRDARPTNRAPRLTVRLSLANGRSPMRDNLHKLGI